MKTIALPCYGITITLDNSDRDAVAGSITSGLHEPLDEEAADEPQTALYEAAIDGLESLILACACEGLDVESPAFLCAIETAVEAIDNHRA